MKIRLIIPVLLLLLFIASLYPAIRHTRAWAGDAHGLIMLALAARDDLSFNPYSENGLLMTPDMAFWILRHLNYPYASCVDILRPVDICAVPLIMWAGRELGMGGSWKNERAHAIVKLLITRGEPVNELHEGFTAVHEAILFNQPEYLRRLLDAGGDPTIPIRHAGKEYDGYDARQFYELVKSKRAEDMTAIGRLLEQYP